MEPAKYLGDSGDPEQYIVPHPCAGCALCAGCAFCTGCSGCSSQSTSVNYVNTTMGVGFIGGALY